MMEKKNIFEQKLSGNEKLVLAMVWNSPGINFRRLLVACKEAAELDWNGVQMAIYGLQNKHIIVEKMENRKVVFYVREIFSKDQIAKLLEYVP
ncbi:MAG: hypothetical protein ACE5J3_12880 [Methanosarcinales archaeon]